MVRALTWIVRDTGLSPVQSTLFHLSHSCFKEIIIIYRFKCFMIYLNTPLTSSLPSPMQTLQSRSARSDLPMSNVARKQLGLDPGQLSNKYKNDHLPLHDLHLGQNVMLKDTTSKQWLPATITSLCLEPTK